MAQLLPHYSNYSPAQPFPEFQQPRILDGFSLEQDRSFQHSRKFLKYLRLPQNNPPGIDLNLGYEDYVPGPKEVNINSLLEFLGRKKSLLEGPDFVCYRGLLTRIFISPYFPSDPWTILATRYRGVIYLCHYTSPEQQQAEDQRQTEYSQRCCYYGKNFERFIFTGEPRLSG